MASISDYGADFNKEDVATQLREAMSGLGTDEKELVRILSSFTNGQLQEARTEFATVCGEDLIEKVKSEVSGGFQDCCVALIQERWEFLASLVHGALKGIGTSEYILVDVFGTMEPADIDELKVKYQEFYETEMSEDLEGDLGGDFEKFSKALVDGQRTCDGEDEEDDDHNAVCDAQCLFDAAEGAGTDEMGFLHILMKRSWSRIRDIVVEYQTLAESEDPNALLNRIQSEFTGNEEKMLTTIVKYALDPVDCFADVLNECLDGVGTSEWRLIYTIVRRCEVDLADVAAKYEEKFGETLTDKIDGDVHGDLKDLLIRLVVGNAPE